MRTRTVTVREGENVGPIDWSYDFLSHFASYCTSDERRADLCARSIEQLRTVEERFKAGKKTLATTDGGWPRFGWHEVVDVGMYDGWPYWKPVPSVMTRGPLGGEWHAFSFITDIDTRTDS